MNIWPFKTKSPETRSTLEALFDSFRSQNTTAGVAVTSDTAASLPAVFAAVSFISKQVASYELTSPNAAVERLLTVSPDEVMTANTFKLAVVQNLLMSGNAYARIHWGSDGWPKRLEFLQSVRVQPNIDPNHNLIGYWVDGTAVLPNNMVHWKIHSLDGLTGRSPVTVARDTIGLGIAYQNQASNQMANGLRPSGVIEAPFFLNTTNGSKFKESLNERKPGETLVLEGEAKWVQTGLSNSDAEFLASRQFSVIEVARIFGLSKIWLSADENGARYDNISAEQRSLLLTTIAPYLDNISAELSLKLMVPCSFKNQDVSRLDPATRYEIYEKAITAGILSKEEVREKEGF